MSFFWLAGVFWRARTVLHYCSSTSKLKSDDIAAIATIAISLYSLSSNIVIPRVVTATWTAK
jgi:hypothetical protein